MMQKGVRFILLVLGSMIAALGIACCLVAGLGVDPITVFIDGLSIRLGVSVGVAAMINSGLILLVFFIIDRSYIKIGTLIVLFLLGEFLDIFCGRLVVLEPYFSVYGWARFLVLGIGMILVGIGFATCIAAKLGPSAPDIPVIFLGDRFHIPMKYAKMMMDAFFAVIGYLLGGKVGIGTILCVFCIGFIYQITSEFIASTTLNSI